MFIWDGSRLVQEYNYKGTYTYIYTDQDSYEPLAHVFYNNKDEKLYLSYYHTDQIGIPREQTDQFGNLLWTGEYDAWGKLTAENKIYPNAHQPFRLQNQYFDQETGLHYNLFRYYAPECGRFVSQDPIGLWGGEHLYSFAPNSQMWVDVFGLSKARRQQQIALNSAAGKRRENEFQKILEKDYPNARIERERYLRDCKTGKSVRYKGSRRRIDFVVIENLDDLEKRRSKCFEITSLGANKEEQENKEKKIREAGGLCIRLRGFKGNKGLVEVPMSATVRLL